MTRIDFAASALHEFGKLAERLAPERSVDLIEQDLNDCWHIPDRAAGAVFAITVIENFVESGQQHHFSMEICRILKPGGLLVLEYYTPRDGYYSVLLDSSPLKEKGIVIDPNNAISFRIFTGEEILALMNPAFETVMNTQFTWDGVKYGKPCTRTSDYLVLRKKV